MVYDRHKILILKNMKCYFSVEEKEMTFVMNSEAFVIRALNEFVRAFQAASHTTTMDGFAFGIQVNMGETYAVRILINNELIHMDALKCFKDFDFNVNYGNIFFPPYI